MANEIGVPRAVCGAFLICQTGFSSRLASSSSAYFAAKVKYSSTALGITSK